MELLSTLSSPDTSQSLLWLPKADPGFKRSLALLHQISLLSEGYGDDYIVRSRFSLIAGRRALLTPRMNLSDRQSIPCYGK